MTQDNLRGARCSGAPDSMQYAATQLSCVTRRIHIFVAVSQPRLLGPQNNLCCGHRSHDVEAKRLTSKRARANKTLHEHVTGVTLRLLGRGRI